MHALDDTGCSALHEAADEDQAGSVDALIEAGADTELCSNVGLTPLANAAPLANAKSSLALLRHGAAIDARDNAENTPMHHACFRQSKGLEAVVGLLLR